MTPITLDPIDTRGALPTIGAITSVQQFAVSGLTGVVIGAVIGWGYAQISKNLASQPTSQKLKSYYKSLTTDSIIIGSIAGGLTYITTAWFT